MTRTVLHPSPCPVLAQMLATEQTVLPDGTKERVMGGIRAGLSAALYQTVLRERPQLVIEIGMAQGVSTLSILSALKQTGGRMISIDPYMHSLKWGQPWTNGMAAALHAVERGGYSDIHQHVHAKSCQGLPPLLASGQRAQFAYIDGAHDFANCFVDYYYLDRILDDRGVMAFNDAGWLGVWSTIKYLQNSKRYIELDVGLPKNYAGRNSLITAVRWIAGAQRQDRYFRKLRTPITDK